MGKSIITGIDIGHDGVKAVTVKPIDDHFMLMDYQELPIETGIFSDNHKTNYQEIVKKLKELRKSLPFLQRRVALAIPDNSVISKVLQLDSQPSDPDIEFIIAQAFCAQMALNMDDIQLDFFPLHHVDHSHSLVDYQVYATKKEVIENHCHPLQAAKLSPVFITIHAHTLLQLWHIKVQRTHSRQWLLVNVDVDGVQMVIDFLEVDPFTRSMPLPHNGRSSPEVVQSMEETARNENESLRFVIGELQRCRQQLLTLHECHIEGIWLCGRGASPFSAEQIEHHLDIICELFDPFDLLVTKSSQGDPVAHSSYAIATGLAMRALCWQGQSHVA